MNTSWERLLADSKDIWDLYYMHPFILGLQNGDLDPDKFTFYILRDYLYPRYARFSQWALAKAKSHEYTAFSGILTAITHVEMNLLQRLYGRSSMKPDELGNSARSLDNLSYTSYMLRGVAYPGARRMRDSCGNFCRARLATNMLQTILAKTIRRLLNTNCTAEVGWLLFGRRYTASNRSLTGTLTVWLSVIPTNRWLSSAKSSAAARSMEAISGRWAGTRRWSKLASRFAVCSLLPFETALVWRGGIICSGSPVHA